MAETQRDGDAELAKLRKTSEKVNAVAGNRYLAGSIILRTLATIEGKTIQDKEIDAIINSTNRIPPSPPVIKTTKPSKRVETPRHRDGEGLPVAKESKRRHSIVKKKKASEKREEKTKAETERARKRGKATALTTDGSGDEDEGGENDEDET